MVSAACLWMVTGFVPVWAQEKPAAAAQTDVKPTVPAPAPSSAPVEEEKPTGELSVSGLTAYIWRGYENTRNSVVVQPSLTVGYKGFSRYATLFTDQRYQLQHLDGNGLYPLLY